MTKTPQRTLLLAAACCAASLGAFVALQSGASAPRTPDVGARQPARMAEPIRARLAAVATAEGHAVSHALAQSGRRAILPAHTVAIAKTSQRPLRGRVIDDTGAAVSGALVHPCNSRAYHARSDANGEFEFDVPAVLDAVVCEMPGYVTIVAPKINGESYVEVVLGRVASPLTVEVIDASTLAPLLAANVVVDIAAGSVRATTGDGRAIFRDLSLAQPLEVRAQRPGYTDATITLADGWSDEPVVIELTSVAPCASISGVVRSQAGRPVAGAEIAAGQNRSRSRADGHFTVRVEGPWPPSITAYHGTHGAVVEALGGPSGPSRPSGAARTCALDLTLTELPSGPQVALSVRGGAFAGEDVRVVPAGPGGLPDPFAPHWLTTRPDADGALRLPIAGSGVTTFFALDKNGEVLRRLSAPSETERLSQ